jgi:hypothetical protein
MTAGIPPSETILCNIVSPILPFIPAAPVITMILSLRLRFIIIDYVLQQNDHHQISILSQRKRIGLHMICFLENRKEIVIKIALRYANIKHLVCEIAGKFVLNEKVVLRMSLCFRLLVLCDSLR